MTYIFLSIDLTPNRYPFGAKLIGKLPLQSKLGLIEQDWESVTLYIFKYRRLYSYIFIYKYITFKTFIKYLFELYILLIQKLNLNKGAKFAIDCL